MSQNARPGANYIGGRWVPAQAGATFERRNPADPADLIGVFPASAAADAAGGVGLELDGPL